jgi:hypothetical protein
MVPESPLPELSSWCPLDTGFAPGHCSHNMLDLRQPWQRAGFPPCAHWNLGPVANSPRGSPAVIRISAVRASCFDKSIWSGRESSPGNNTLEFPMHSRRTLLAVDPQRQHCSALITSTAEEAWATIVSCTCRVAKTSCLQLGWRISSRHATNKKMGRAIRVVMPVNSGYQQAPDYSAVRISLLRVKSNQKA